MEKQKKKDSGITLVALVVSIIVMLVLAGVSLNATIGENGIVTRAQEASLQHKIATDLENLNLELAKVNVDTISTDSALATNDVVSYLIDKGVIDRAVTTSAGQIAAGIDTATGNRYFFGVKGDNTYKISKGKDDLLYAELTQNASGGDITGGYALVTAESFNNDSSLSAEEKGKFTITSDAEVVFMDSVSGSLSIKVNPGVHATVGIYANMTLSNSGIRRSAIDIAPTGTLDLYIGDGVTLTVNSGLGVRGNENDYQNINPGGYAGIRCVSTADGISTLNIRGSGTIIATGGDAADGNTYTGNSNSSIGGTGGGGAGAGIGGNGGYGSGYVVGKGSNGGAGEDCGNVNIYGTVTVKAYGGAGGSGANGTVENGAGGGGYPAAGIGGGGAGAAGGTCCTGGGGYSGGGGDGYIGRAGVYHDLNRGYGATGGENGDASERLVDAYKGIHGGGGYNVEDLTQINPTLFNTNTFTTIAGGMGGVYSRSDGHYAGNGGTAGKGGNVYVNNTGGKITVEGKQVDNKATILAFNGNKYTDDTSYNEGLNQTIIYSQNGIINARYVVGKAFKNSDTNYEIEYTVEQTYDDTLAKSGYTNPTTNNTQGVGSGAGYIEVDNGHYYLCSESNAGVLTPQ